MESSSPSLSSSSSLCEEEAKHYYAGLPSCPRLVARTSTTLWVSTKEYNKAKELRAVFNHGLVSIWKQDVAPKVVACLDVQFTSIDVLRIGVVGESFAPIVLWIGVEPKSLPNDYGHTVALRCLNVLRGFGVEDIDVEIRESSIIGFAGPRLLPPVLSSDPTADIRDPITHALGLPIAAEATPHVEGTGGFFMAMSKDSTEAMGQDSEELLLVTARHAVLPPNECANVTFEHQNSNQDRFNILVLGDDAYKRYVASIRIIIDGLKTNLAQLERRRNAVAGKDDSESVVERHTADNQMPILKQQMQTLNTFSDEVTRWATRASRVLGHLLYSPPMRFAAGTALEQYTQDFAIIKIDSDKINRTKFRGNVIDLGFQMDEQKWRQKMRPNSNNPPSFVYPDNRLLKLSGTIPDKEMRHPTSVDKAGEPCLMVIKDGATTGVTIGRANGIESILRASVAKGGAPELSFEWTILPYDNHSGKFSDEGDSGAVIVDGLGRIGGLLTAGTGARAYGCDVTYATPISFIEKSIKAKYPNAHLNP